MPRIGDELKTYLKTITAITDIVGVGVAARIYEFDGKQGQPVPHIIFQVLSGSSASHLGGISGIATNRIKIVAYGSTANAAHKLAEGIRLSPLQNFRGTMGTTFVNSVLSNGGYEEGRDKPTRGQPPGGPRRYWCSRDYIFTYQEPITAS